MASPTVQESYEPQLAAAPPPSPPIDPIQQAQQDEEKGQAIDYSSTPQVLLNERLAAVQFRSVDEMKAAFKQVTMGLSDYGRSLMFVLSSSFNFYVLVNNYATRPARDPSLQFNLATIIIANIELWLVVTLLGGLVLVNVLRLIGRRCNEPDKPVVDPMETVTFCRVWFSVMKFSALSLFFESQNTLIVLKRLYRRIFAMENGCWCCCSWVITLIVTPISIGFIPLGAVGVALKISQMQFVSNVAVGSWSVSEWITFLGFINTLAFSIDLTAHAKKTLVSLLDHVQGKENTASLLRRPSELFEEMLDQWFLARDGPTVTFVSTLAITDDHITYLLLHKPEASLLGI